MTDVVIVGGGLGGLAAALALAREDLAVTVLEAGSGPPPDHFGYTIWPPGTRVLEWLGVLDEVVAGGCELQRLRWYDEHGHEWSSLALPPLAELGRFVGARPSRVVSALRAAADGAGVRIVDRARDWRLTRTGHGWNVRLAAETIDCDLVIGSDGPRSRVRACMGVPAWLWRAPRQRLLTGIGGALPWPESRQAMGRGWSGGCVSLGACGSWQYAIVHEQGAPDPARVRRYGTVDTTAVAAQESLTKVIEVRPASVRVSTWARDGVLLTGDAAHGMLPHLGLGGSQALEDVPVLAEVVSRALRRGDTRGETLGEFQRRRAARVAYARRVSELWALSTTAVLPLVGRVRDANLRRVAGRPQLLETLVRELASARVPRLETRLRVLLP
jgi:salicylate hydroxylase